jgi:hypothetical protein
MTKKGEDYTTNPEPHYYQGKKYGYSARKVVEDFELSYNMVKKMAILKSKTSEKLLTICTLS